MVNFEAMATELKAPRPVTAKQLKLLHSLVKQVDVPIEMRAVIRAELDAGMTTKMASSHIRRLFDMRDADRAERRAA